ncbi:hypothetical protein F5141DRAFT_1065758 [Pisolithus sp. B1]|nr:hypothetical protein F5141DRAFT_1065758 [Pisolithus sp. B1]
MSNKNIPTCSPTSTQPFPPLTSPISPPVPTLDQPHENPPTPAMSDKIIPISTSTQHQPAPSPHQHPPLTSPYPPSTSPISTPLPASTYLQHPTLASLYTSCSPPSHIFMARTKQSARKVTGGHAPRVNLEVLQKKKAKAKAASKKPPLKIQAKDNAVIICLDGGEMWICDEEGCHRVVCHGCLIVSEESLQKTKNDPKPYMGFYSKGEPALSTPPIIPGGFHHAMTSQAAPHPTALLHLHLEGLAQDIGHSQVAMLHSFLQAYFPQGDYNFSQLSFNLGAPESMDAYDKAASDLANTLSAYSRVVLFLTTHSDEDRGDLFTGYINKKPVAYKVLPFLQLLLKSLSKIINGADIIFYVCGSVVTNPQSFNGVKEVAQQSMLLFDAQYLQLASTVPYLQSLLDNTIIQGFPISSAAKVALNECGRSSSGRKVSLD